MTVEELKKARDRLEVEILRLLSAFQQDTGVSISHVNVEVVDTSTSASERSFVGRVLVHLNL